MIVPTTAFLLGAEIIEKHFTYNKNLPGNDHYHSMDYKDLKKLRSNLKKILDIIGKKKSKQPIPSEKKAIKNARRSIVVAKNIKKGEKFSEQNLTFKRPAVGLSISEWENVIGKKAKINLKKNKVINKNHIT
jgi:N-acetylneuraminate synthase